MKDIDLNKLKELSERVNYGGFTVGDSGYSVESSSGYFADCLGMDEASFIYAANPAVVIALIEQLEAAQRERDEFSHRDYLTWHAAACKFRAERDEAEAELKRRDAQEPDGHIFCHPNGKLFWSVSDDSNAGRNGVRPFYFAAPAAALPPKISED